MGVIKITLLMKVCWDPRHPYFQGKRPIMSLLSMRVQVLGRIKTANHLSQIQVPRHFDYDVWGNGPCAGLLVAMAVACKHNVA